MTPSAHRRLSPVVRWLCILLSLLVLSLTACPIDEGIDGGGGGGSGGGGGGGGGGDDGGANTAPEPTAPLIITTANVPGVSAISVNDSEVNQTHQFAITTAPTNAIAAITTTGVVTYTPGAGFTGTDRLVVTVTDNGSPPLSGTVTIDVRVLLDVNADGRPDLVVANEGSDDIALLLGNDDGTFQTQRRVTTGPGPIAVAAADVNADGRSDLDYGQ